MTPADLIAIYGADTARWPAEDRDAALAAVAADPALQALLADAAALDAMLGAWAIRTPAPGDADGVAARIVRPAPRWPRVAGFGGLIAAAVAAVVLVAPPTLAPAPVATTLTSADTDAADAADFATLFTPTPDEESLT